MEPAKTESKKGAEGAEPSMEEILHSIKKIIAEEEDGKPAVAAEPAKTNGNNAPDDVQGSDVLELTDMIEEPAKPAEAPKAEAKAETPPPAPPAAPAPAAPVAAAAPAPAAPSNDVLSKIDEALAVEKPAAPAPAPAAPAPVAPAPGSELLSDQAAIAASSAFKKLQTAAEPPLPAVNTSPSPAFVSGKTVEIMVMEMLRPMMKEWLDKNLPAIVERIVTVEIRKLTK